VGNESATGAVDVSVVIVSYNTLALTRACLRTVYEQTKGTIEVIVVDNASADGSVEMIAREFPRVRLVANPDNRGFAAANNQGFTLALGRYVLLLNSDTEVLDGAIDRTVAFADLHPEAGVVGCRAVYGDGSPQSTAFRFLRLGEVAANALVPKRLMTRSRWLGRARYVGVDLGRVQSVEAVAGCFMLVRREVIERVGPLDEAFFMYGEEAEWCYRIRKAGWQIYYFPGATIVHLEGASGKPRSARTILAVAKGQLLFLQRTRGSAAAYVANMLMLARDLPRAAVWAVLGWLPPTRDGTLRRELGPSAARLGLHAGGLWRRDWSR
jgi:GT2 family glycosyltransferase